MELLAYHKWLLRESQGERMKLAILLIQNCIEQNPMAFELLEKTGDKAYNRESFFKAADLILNNNGNIR